MSNTRFVTLETFLKEETFPCFWWCDTQYVSWGGLVQGQDLNFSDPYGSLPSQNILWFYVLHNCMLSSLICIPYPMCGNSLFTGKPPKVTRFETFTRKIRPCNLDHLKGSVAKCVTIFQLICAHSLEHCNHRPGVAPGLLSASHSCCQSSPQGCVLVRFVSHH